MFVIAHFFRLRLCFIRVDLRLTTAVSGVLVLCLVQIRVDLRLTTAVSVVCLTDHFWLKLSASNTDPPAAYLLCLLVQRHCLVH